MKDDCIFCNITSGKSKATIEFETETVIVFKNIKPVADEHLLIIPKDHIESFLDIPKGNIISDMLRVAQEMIKQKGIQGGYKLVFNGGKYQAVHHLHWHLLGGKLQDENDAINKT